MSTANIGPCVFWVCFSSSSTADQPSRLLCTIQQLLIQVLLLKTPCILHLHATRIKSDLKFGQRFFVVSPVQTILHLHWIKHWRAPIICHTKHPPREVCALNVVAFLRERAPLLLNNGPGCPVPSSNAIAQLLT